MPAGARRSPAEALAWLCDLAVRRVDGAEEPAWLDALDARAEDIDEALTDVLEAVLEATPATGRELGDIGVALARWWRTTGKITEGCGWLVRIAQRLPEHAQLQAWTAHLLISAGRLEAALEHAAAAGSNDLALVARAHVCVIHADYAAAEALLRQVAGTTDPDTAFEATVVAAQAATRQQHFPELAALATRAQRLAWESGLDRQLAQALLLSHTSHRLQGRTVQAEAAATEALQIATLARASTLMAVALGGLGGLRVEAGDLDGARTVLQRSLDLTVHGGDVRATLVTTNNLGETERLAGNAAAARRLFGVALRSAKVLGDERAVGFMLTALAELALAEGDPAAATDPLREAVQLRASVGDSRGLILSLEGTVLWAAASGRGPEAAQLLGAADAARDELGMARDPQLVAPLEQAISESFGTEVEAGSARRLGGTLDLEAAGQLALQLLGGSATTQARARPARPRVAAEPLASLALLGGFSLAVAGVPVDARAWQSRKARDLLKILAVAQGHPVTRESVMEWLWPDSDPAALPARLSVALSTLRAVLGPAREAVIADRDALALDLTVIEIDLVDFQRLVAAGEHALAVERYAGELLPGDVFAEWPTLAREAAAAAFTSAAHAAADAAATRGDHAETALLCRRILTVDPYDERAHRRLIDALRRNGAHGEVQRARAGYAAKMAEIGVTATP